MKSGYSIQTHTESSRFIVWRILENGNKLRQGSFETEKEAHERIDESIKLMSNS